MRLDLRLVWILVRLSGLAMLVSTLPPTANPAGAQAFPPVVYLSDVTAGIGGFAVHGAAAFDEAGHAVAAAGDLNDDGIDDLLVGAPLHPDGVEYGHAYVVFGSITIASTSPIQAATLDGTGGFAIRGAADGDRLGFGVTRAGDVNGDAVPDVLLGAPRGGGAGLENDRGESYLVFGGAGIGASGLLDVSALDGSNGFALIGVDLNDQSGRSVAGGLDLNDDGAPDLVAGALFGDPAGRTDAGEAFVVFGGSGVGASGAVQLDSLSGADGFTLNGVAVLDQSTSALSPAGDVNGDGIDDLLIGAHQADPGGASSAGATYVVFGSASGFGAAFELSALDGTNGFVITGIAANDLAGGAAAAAGDVNGDGFADIVIGAERADPGGNSDAGEAYVVFGGPSVAPSGSLDLASLDGSNGFAVPGPAAFARLGSAVAGVGDVDNDGIDDLVIGATGTVTNIFATGAAYVLLGSPAIGATGTVDVVALDGYDGFMIAGIDSNDLAGFSVAGAGDVNGDGIADIAVGATGADPNGNTSGEAYVVFGDEQPPPPPPPFPPVLDLAAAVDGSEGFAVHGAAAFDETGHALAAAGDLNGDGIDDLLVGAPFHPDGVEYGRAYVVFGNPGIQLISPIEASALNGDAGFVIEGVADGDRLGFSLSAAGDVNGDTNVDLLVGAPRSGSGLQNDRGESYVVFGGAGVGASGLVDVASLDGSNGFALIGIDLSDQSGRAVTGGLDLNGDGAADLVTGALFGDPGGRTSAGETFVVFGGSGVGASGAVQLDSLSGADGFVLNGVALQDQSARSVASAGDVNGDGIDDLIVGADQADVGAEANAGTSYVVFGSALPFAASVELSALDGTNGFAISGIASGDLSGIAVAGAGDVNGDGFSDLVIGAERADPGGQSDAGEAYVVFGGADPAPAGILDLALLDGAKGFVVPGPAAFARLGASVAAAGDVDQDGFDDVIIGATAAVTNIFATGAAYVLLGDPAMGASGSIDVTALDGYDGFVVAGIDSSDFAGASVAHAGDLNGDGVDDFAVGAIGADPNGNSSGEVYVILGRPCDACLPDPAPEPGVLTGLLTGVLLLSRLPRRGTRAR